MTYKIEKGVEVPHNKGAPPLSKYPCSIMEPGDSFFVAVADGEHRHDLRARLAAAAYRAARLENKKFSVRLVDGGFRVFRTE